MATKQTRWKCTLCNKGALAPSRPRRDDVRRYCLPCSAKTGKLVERVAPALEKKRAETRERNREKQKATKAKTKQARSAHSGFDVVREVDRLWAILCKQEQRNKAKPTIKLVNRKRVGSSGYCYYGQHHVTLNLGTETIDAWETVAHELVHAIGYRGHGHDFYKCLKRLTEQRWNTTVSSYNWSRPGYACDHDLRRQLTEKAVVMFS